MPKSQNSKPPPGGLLLISVGTLLTSMILVGFGMGLAVDYWLGTAPVFMLLFGLLGIIGGILRVYKLLVRQ